jgi:hypothetical protein
MITCGNVTAPGSYIENVLNYSSIDLTPGVWLVESQLYATSLVDGCSAMLYLSLSTVSGTLNTSNASFNTIFLNSSNPILNRITGTFTVTENTTVYTILSLFNCTDSAGVQGDQTVNLENTPLFVATRIA